jgi:hypothetical protein
MATAPHYGYYISDVQVGSLTASGTTRDPLEALTAPKRNAAPESTLPDGDAVTEMVDAAAEQLDRLSSGYNHLVEVADHTSGHMESIRKVVQCYDCESFAFDGTLTAFETDDEGPQPFCAECVRKIEHRSRLQPLGTTWGTLFGNGVQYPSFNYFPYLSHGTSLSAVSSVTA